MSSEVETFVFQALTDKFSSEIPQSSHRSFPDEYFTCVQRCNACNCRCSKTINHEGEHKTHTVCVYQKQYENKKYFCLRCYQRGQRVICVPKATSSTDGALMGMFNYVWTGYVLECTNCGVIYQSRAKWYANAEAENMSVVQTEIHHIWPGTRTLQVRHLFKNLIVLQFYKF